MFCCSDTNGVFRRLIHEQTPLEWRVFIDCSQQSLKAVLHNENSKPSIPIAHSVHLKETYDEIKLLLEAIQYNVQQRGICGELRMIVMLMGM